MARNADIRVWISSVLPTENISVVASVLKDIINKVEGLQKTTKNTSAEGLNIQLVASDKFKILPSDDTYFLGDVKRAAAEFDLLGYSWTKEQSYFIGNYFEDADETFAEAMGGWEEVGKLGGRIHAAIMKRFYNWERSGSANPITLPHTLDNVTVATVTIPGLTLVEGEHQGLRHSQLQSTIIVFKDTDLIHKGKFGTSVKSLDLSKTLPRYQEEYETVKAIINKIPVNRREFDQFHLLDNLVKTIACYNTPLFDYKDVHLAFDLCRYTMTGMINKVNGETLITISVCRNDHSTTPDIITEIGVPLSTLVIGLNTYRLREKVPNHNMWVVGSFETMQDALFNGHAETATALALGFKQNGYSQSDLDGLSIDNPIMNGVRLIFNGTGMFDVMFNLERHVKDSIYIFDSIYNISELQIDSLKEEDAVKVEVVEPKRGFFSWLRSMFCLA
ncbi:hypothetical protein PQD71_gp044 [Kosakonia phage Kc263]|uniref:Uncharacterized protein n=1 Tax=Kosakonia phage Kc263 TaxID=2863194 RepID=A0AAE7WF70_9CAUD|nr:hypothetical protein PQD71_gp044 [Kosakonia phage Kc263]QYN79937.1 hypothetical protein [Kosakonia phage Kc263]